MYVRPLAELSVIKVDPPYTWFLSLRLSNRADVAAILSVPYVGTPDLIDDACINRRRPYSRSTYSGRPTKAVVKPDSTPRADEALAAFKSGRATDVNSLALALDVSVDRARKQVQRLKRVGLIEVAQGGQRGRPEALRAAGEGWLLPGDA
ncbi:MAG TPA: hypothetical protein VIK31_11800 [Propionibacteriaceae bacterium]